MLPNYLGCSDGMASRPHEQVVILACLALRWEAFTFRKPRGLGFGAWDLGFRALG